MAKAPHTIVHIPHSSRLIPTQYREQFVLSDSELEREKLLLTDTFTDEIYDINDGLATTVKFPVSRLLVDPERILDDSKEPMAAVGMGAVYTRRTNGRPLRRGLSARERKELILEYYSPHHRAVGEAVKSALEGPSGRVLIIDCHSFPSSPLPCDSDQTLSRPNICVGSDIFHTPNRIVASLVDKIEGYGLSCEIDKPYAGTFVPEPYFRKNGAVSSIMLEINRSLYMDESTGRKKPEFTVLTEKMQDIVASLIHAENALHKGVGT